MFSLSSVYCESYRARPLATRFSSHIPAKMKWALFLVAVAVVAARRETEAIIALHTPNLPELGAFFCHFALR